MLDKATVVNITKRYADAVRREFSPSSIILFGSYAKGNAREESDIDVGVIFNGLPGDWLKTSSRLWHLTNGISFDIEPHLLDTAHDPSGFVQHVLKTGEVIYKA
jgi:predicted nucleotidyltransferase